MVATDEITKTGSYYGISEVISHDSQSLKSNNSNDSQSNNNDASSNLSENNDARSLPKPHDEVLDLPIDESKTPQVVKPRITLVILLIANLINYMDRYTIAGVLIQVQEFYNISNAQLGLLQTSFIISYMLLSPLFGYLGDRRDRKICLAVGIAFWSLITLLSSFVPSNYFGVFLFLRALVGVGEASYSTIAPTIIADLFCKGERTKALSVFYFAIPVGSGLGYIVGAQVASFAGNWYWALRVTPGIGLLCALGIMVLVVEPVRGASDGVHSQAGTSFKEDISYLLKHKSFLTSTFGFTCVSFVAGALALWAPTYMHLSFQINDPTSKMETVSFWFGVVTCLAGLLGVIGGLVASGQLRKKYQSADAIICAVGLLAATPFFFLALVYSKSHTFLTWISIFLGETFMSLNWALVTDILLYTVIPTRRSSAEAIQILVSHLLGDAGSPYLIGLLYDTMALKYKKADVEGQQSSLQYALFLTCFVCVIGSGFFFATSIFLVKDKEETDNHIKMALQRNINSSGAALIANNSIPDIPDFRRKCDPGTLITRAEDAEDRAHHANGVNGSTTFL